MKNMIASLLLLALVPATSFAREPKATACGEAQITAAVVGFLSLNLDKQAQKEIVIKKTILTQMGYDANGNEVTENTVKWGFKTGEMSFETYSLDIKLSSATLNRLGTCRILSVVQSETIE